MGKSLKAGLYKRNITPPVTGCIAGGFNEPEANDILDEFYANALVLDDGIKEFAIVSLDTLLIPGKVAEYIAYSVEKLCSIPASNIMLHANHNHTGVKLHEDINDVYTEFLKESVVSAVYLAKKRKQDVHVGVGKGQNKKHVYNRRLKKPDGSIVMNFASRDFLQDCDSSGVTDPEMIVVKLENNNFTPVGFIINYANHNNSVSGGARSSDISGHIAELLRKIYGEHVVTIFLVGACGNTNWINYRDYTQQGDSKLYKKIATGLTGTALNIISEIKSSEVESIDIIGKTIKLSERPFNEYDDKIDNTFGDKNKDTSWNLQSSAFSFFKKAKKLGINKQLTTYELDLHALRLGSDIAISTNPVELFAELGLEIKKASPFEYTMISELTNGYYGYVPTKNAYEEGGYEIRKPANKLEKKAGRVIVDTSIELLNKLKESY